jgi:hypothetical protein
MAEVLPTNYEAICKDRIDGGVLIAVKNTLISVSIFAFDTLSVDYNSCKFICWF